MTHEPVKIPRLDQTGNRLWQQTTELMDQKCGWVLIPQAPFLVVLELRVKRALALVLLQM
jgi:hypothetical protein